MTTANQKKRGEDMLNGQGMAPCSGQRPGDTHPPTEGFRRRSFSTFQPSLQPAASSRHNPQLRWSCDFSGGGASPVVVVVRKTRATPQPPMRSVSLPLHLPPSSSSSSSKRHSCPPVPVPASPVKTAAITGPSPLGCRMRPRTSPRHPPTSRLSLQMPFIAPPTVPASPDAKGCSPERPDGATAAAAPVPRRSRRCHSDSSAFCRSWGPQLPAVTLEELRTVRLNLTNPALGGSDGVFDPEGAASDNDGGQEEVELKAAPALSPKVAPSVPTKSEYSIWLAHLVAQSLSVSSEQVQSGGPAQQLQLDAASQGEAVYAQVKKRAKSAYSACAEGRGSAVPGYR
ncbi:hypothetical protein CRUP_004888 [Coryphaenoides rupestris]|nr:hypothetical protein CRUP_004888 [Coryphaenoides rupestris]